MPPPTPVRVGPPPWLLMLADSELAACTVTPGASAAAGATVVLAFAAAHLRQPGGESGHAPGLRLVLSGAAIDGGIGPGRLCDGRLWHGGRWQLGWEVPGLLSATADAPLRLELGGAHGDALSVTALTLSVQWTEAADGGPAGWRPWLHC